MSDRTTRLALWSGQGQPTCLTCGEPVYDSPPYGLQHVDAPEAAHTAKCIPRVKVEYITEEELTHDIDGILATYPYFADIHPADCCSDTGWEIAQEHGYEAGVAWAKYENLVWLLTGRKPT